MATSAFLPSGFEYRRMDVDGVTINFAVAGSGPPLLLLHGYPQNHLMWRHVAPVLARDHTVVLADLRGYGDSGKPAPDDAGRVYSKRSMARDQLGLMRQLGFGPFQLVGHDRGARVSHRLVLDHPGAVTRLAVLDIVPTRHVLHNVTRAMATAYYHWFFLPVGNGVPEHLIGADPAYWIRSLIGPLLGKGASIEPAVMDDYIRCFSDRTPRTSAIASAVSTYALLSTNHQNGPSVRWRCGLIQIGPGLANTAITPITAPEPTKRRHPAPRRHSGPRQVICSQESSATMTGTIQTQCSSQETGASSSPKHAVTHKADTACPRL